MYNDQLVYKVVIWAFFGISLCKEKVALIIITLGAIHNCQPYGGSYVICAPEKGVEIAE